ncbi:MAG: hypothetical protein HOQ18_12565 [Dermatophilaceae bacterium]|nr:hypothetical protein [Dermatophilaceae bacterium]
MRVLLIGSGGVGDTAERIAAERDVFEPGSSPTTTRRDHGVQCAAPGPAGYGSTWGTDER